MVSAVCGGIRVASPVRAQRARRGLAVLRGQAALVRAAGALAGRVTVRRRAAPAGRRLQRHAGADEDVWERSRAHGGTHVSAPEREALARLRDWGLVDAYRSLRPEPGRFSWWDYRAGMFHRNEGMRIDLLYVTPPVAERVGLGRDRPRGAQGPADALGPCAGRHRPRRAGQAVRCRLGGRAGPDRREDQAPPLIRVRRAWRLPLAPIHGRLNRVVATQGSQAETDIRATSSARAPPGSFRGGSRPWDRAEGYALRRRLAAWA